jgi:hypothetical protein
MDHGNLGVALMEHREQRSHLVSLVAFETRSDGAHGIVAPPDSDATPAPRLYTEQCQKVAPMVKPLV